MRILNEIIGKELGKNPHKTTALSGGDINKVYHCIYEEKELVIKFNIANKYPKMFEKESKGLRLLSATNFKTPKTIATGNFKNHNYLILEYIQPGNKLNWIKFGENLALMHQITNQKFGLDYDNYIGSIQQINNYEDSWEEFYANRRILHLTILARDRQLLNSNEAKRIEQLCNKLENLVPKNKPCLIHGDLWSGNLISDKNNDPVLIDPAVYYGHPEMDWAMLSLFGDYPTIAMEKYNEINQIEKDFEKRKEIHQLYPLLVHLVLFGEDYCSPVMNIVKKFN